MKTAPLDAFKDAVAEYRAKNGVATRRSRKSVEKSILAVVTSWATNRSKDPSTKVGAAIYDLSTGSMFLGYNGFPSGVRDDEDLWQKRHPTSKYDVVVHAEQNAARKALRAGSDPGQWILVCTHYPCATCWRDVIAANGVRNVCYHHGAYPSQQQRDLDVARFFIHELQINARKI
jgi:dCMP deaminase